MKTSDKPIRVLQWIVANDCGGLTKYVCDNYQFIDKSKVQFDFLTYDDFLNFQEAFEKKGAHFFKIPRPRQFMSFIKQIKEIVTKNKYEVVHCNLSYANILPIILFWWLGIERIIIHSHSTQIDSHNVVIRNMKKIYHFIGRLFLPFLCTDYFACYTEAAKWMFNGPIFRNKRYIVMENAIDLNLFLPNREKRKQIRKYWGASDDCVVLGNVGRFTYPKNHEFLLKVFRSYNSINNNSILVMVGSGPDMQKIQGMVTQARLEDKVHFLGMRNDVYDVLQAMDCFLLPSEFEGLGTVGIEAQAAGIRCLLSRKIPREIDITGLVTFLPIEKGDEKSWSEELKKTTDFRHVNTKKMIIESGYEIHSAVKKVMNIYLKNTDSK